MCVITESIITKFYCSFIPDLKANAFFCRQECDKHRIQAQNLIEENSRLEHEREAITEAQMEDELQGTLDAMHKGALLS